MISIVTFVVAFCSIVYELVLGQALSAFLGNTILRYSVTIGLYLFAMGFGAMFAEGKWIKRPIKSFMLIEILLTLFGGFSIIALFALEFFIGTGLMFVVFAHSLIILIGILTGFEIPLLIAMGKKYVNLKAHVVLGIDYLGAFLGSITFSFIFYSKLGLIPTAFATALLNGVAGMAIYIYAKMQSTAESRVIVNKVVFVLQTLIIVALFFGIYFSGAINDYFIDRFVT